MSPRAINPDSRLYRATLVLTFNGEPTGHSTRIGFDDRATFWGALRRHWPNPNGAGARLEMDAPTLAALDGASAEESKTDGAFVRCGSERDFRCALGVDVTVISAATAAARALGSRGGAAGKGKPKPRSVARTAKARGAKGGAAGTGAAKARTSEQARAAARARWDRPKP